jgi:hypothetical protein
LTDKSNSGRRFTQISADKKDQRESALICVPFLAPGASFERCQTPKPDCPHQG